jgi:hypothetical protein
MARSFLGCAALLPAIALLATNVAAHGYVQSIVVNGTNLTGPKPVNQAAAQKLQTPIRQIASEQPVVLNSQGVTSPLLACGASNNAPATELVSIAAGSPLTIQWVNGGGRVFWPHNTGPLMTYMAACQKTDCSDDPATLAFFKIAEEGQTTPGGTIWAQKQLYEGRPVKVTVPSGIPTGPYIMRHEVINLALASTGQAEAYPSCFQLQVTGGGSSSPTEFVKSLGSNVARFPGAYKTNDAGLNFDPYTSGKNYPFPGPKIAKAIGGGGGGDNGGGDETPAPTSTPTRSISTSTLQTGTSTTSTTSPRPPVNPGSTPTRSPRVITTTVTEVFVLTMTIPDDPNNRNFAVTTTTTTTSSSQLPTTTSTNDPDDGCFDEEEEEKTSTGSTPPNTTTTSSVTTTTGYARRHARRSERWRVAAMGS